MAISENISTAVEMSQPVRLCSPHLPPVPAGTTEAASDVSRDRVNEIISPALPNTNHSTRRERKVFRKALLHPIKHFGATH